MFSGFSGRVAFRHKAEDIRRSSSTEFHRKSYKSDEMSSRLFMTASSSPKSSNPMLLKQNSLTLEATSDSNPSSPKAIVRKSTKQRARLLSHHHSGSKSSQESLEEFQGSRSRRSSSFRKKSKSRSSHKTTNHTHAGKPKWTLATRFGLNNSQKKAIITTWQRLCDFRNPTSTVLLIENVFKDLSKTPSVREMFLSSAFVNTMMLKEGGEIKIQTVRDHAKLLACFLTKVVENINDEPKEILDMMAEFGSQHAHLKGLGLNGKIWEKFGQQLVEHMAIQESVRHSPNAPKAWTVLLAGMVDMICSGFLQPKRKQTAPTENIICVV